jgi:type II secretory pathway component PulM
VKQWYDQANALREEVATKGQEVEALRRHIAALEQQGATDAALVSTSTPSVSLFLQGPIEAF